MELAKKLSRKTSNDITQQNMGDMDESWLKQKTYFDQKVYDFENAPIIER